MTELNTVTQVRQDSWIDKAQKRIGLIATIVVLISSVGGPLWYLTVSQPISDTQTQIKEINMRFDNYSKVVESQIKAAMDQTEKATNARLESLEKQVKSNEDTVHQIRRDIAIQSERILNLTKAITEMKEGK